MVAPQAEWVLRERPRRRAEEGPVAEFYFNTKTREVEEGKPSSWTNRMGPYPTREAAQKALQQADARTEAWDEADAEDERA